MAYIFGSIWDRRNRNALNELSKNVEYQGKSIQDLVAEGQLTPSQYTEMLKVLNGLADKHEVREDTETRPINISEMDTETKQLFTGGSVAVVGENAVGNENVKPKAIDEFNTSFINVGKNKFNGVYENWQIFGQSSNPDTMSIQSSDSNGKTAVIRIEPNKTYTVKKHSGGNRFRAGVMNSYPSVSSAPLAVDRRLFHPDDEITNSVQQFTFTNNSSGMYLCVYVGLTDNIYDIQLQVEEGSRATSFEEYSATLKNVGLSPEVSDEIYELARFSREKITGWKIGALSGSTGNEINNVRRVRTGFIKLKRGQSIETVNESNQQGFMVHEYDVPGQSFIKAGDYIFNYTAVQDIYVRLLTKYVDESVINDTNEFNNEFAFNFSIKPVSAPGKPMLFGDFTTIYKTSPIEGVSVNDDYDLGATTIDDIYSLYDALMAKYPDIITKELRGYGSNADGGEDTNLPIYEYTISPPKRSYDYGARPVKMIVQSGLHGEEKSTVWSALKFFEQMLNDWKTNDSLASIKSNVLFKVIPIANPYGFNTHQRFTARNVDINRNFKNNWDNDSDPRKGTAPYSEVETRLLRDWMIENADTDVYIDFHTFSKEKPDLSFIDTSSVTLQNIYTSLIRRLSDVWRRDYTKDNDNMLYGTISNNNRPMAFREAYHEVGIEMSAILEITMFWGGVKYTQEVMEMGADLFGNYILALLNAYNKM